MSSRLSKAELNAICPCRAAREISEDNSDDSFVSAIHIPTSHPSTLISGGGEPTLQIFDWTTGSLQRRVDILSAVSPYRAVRPPTRKIKGKRKAAGTDASFTPSDDPREAGWYTAPEGHMYPIGQGLAIGQIGSIVVGDNTVVLFYSRGARALHAFKLDSDEIRTLAFGHPVTGFAVFGGKVLVTLDTTTQPPSPVDDGAASGPVALVDVSPDAELAVANSPLVEALTQSLSDSRLQIGEQDKGKLNLYADLQILPRWPGFEDDEAQAAGESVPANVDELAPKRLGRLKAQGHDVHIPAKKKRKSKSERKKARGAGVSVSASGGESGATSEAAGEDEESAMNQG